MTAASLVIDCVVRTADGVLARVRGIYEAGVDVQPLDGDGHSIVTLPAAELRRVPDPRNKRPPIEGMPAERPLCAWCRVKLRPLVDEVRSSHLVGARVLKRTFLRWSCYQGVFCTTRCANTFAGAAYAAGYRRTELTKGGGS